MISGSCAVEVSVLAIEGLDAATRARYESFLSVPEWERYRRFVARGAADQYVAARALLKSRLGAHTGVAPAAWRFRENTFGRPEVDEPIDQRHLRFNLSHTDGMVACIVGRGDSVGIDIENHQRRVDFRQLAPSVFSHEEQQLLRSAGDEHEARDVFFRLWTLKEAYVKARGEGLSIPLDSFSFQVHPAGGRLTRASCGPSPHWRFLTLRPAPAYVLSCGVHRSCRNGPPSEALCRFLALDPCLMPVPDSSAARIAGGV